jgi:putative transposase
MGAETLLPPAFFFHGMSTSDECPPRGWWKSLTFRRNTVGVTGSRAAYRLGASTQSDRKVHGVWVPKDRKAVLTGEVALRGRDLWWPMAAEHEREMVSGKVARDPIHLFLADRPHPDLSPIVPWRK